MNLRERLQKLLTVAYLVSAFVITAATSKGGAPTPAGGISNYSVRSNCPTRPDAIAIRVQNAAISQTLGANGVLNSKPEFDFRSFGFPQSQIVVGLDQNGAGQEAQRRCSVTSKQTWQNERFNEQETSYWFIQPGYLTTVNYDCFNGSTYLCSTQFSELPAGPLSADTQN